MIHGRNGKRKTPAEIAAWKREHQAAQQLATAGPSDAEFLVTPPLDVAALPPPAQPTLDDYQMIATRLSQALFEAASSYHAHFDHSRMGIDDCPSANCKAWSALIAEWQRLAERSKEAQPCSAA